MLNEVKAQGQIIRVVKIARYSSGPEDDPMICQDFLDSLAEYLL